MNTYNTYIEKHFVVTSLYYIMYYIFSDPYCWCNEPRQTNNWLHRLVPISTWRKPYNHLFGRLPYKNRISTTGAVPADGQLRQIKQEYVYMYIRNVAITTFSKKILLNSYELNISKIATYMNPIKDYAYSFNIEM